VKKQECKRKKVKKGKKRKRKSESKVTNFNIKSISLSKICISDNIYKMIKIYKRRTNLLLDKNTKWTSVNNLKVEICK